MGGKNYTHTPKISVLSPYFYSSLLKLISWGKRREARRVHILNSKWWFSHQNFKKRKCGSLHSNQPERHNGHVVHVHKLFSGAPNWIYFRHKEPPSREKTLLSKHFPQSIHAPTYYIKDHRQPLAVQLKIFLQSTQCPFLKLPLPDHCKRL